MLEIQAIVATLQDFLETPNSNFGIKWQANSPDVDIAFRMHRFDLDENKAAKLVQLMKEKFESLDLVGFENGYLNIQLSASTWLENVEKWCEDQATFFQYAGLTIIAQSAPDPSKKMLLAKDMHFLAHARAVSEIPGWQIKHEVTTEIDRNDLLVLKEVLRLGTGKEASDEERLRASKSLVLALRKLWQNPVLVPNAPHASAFRQKILHLGIAGAFALLGERVLLSPVE